MNKWLYNGEPVSDDVAKQHYGFVYKITRIDTMQFYIGCKKFQFKKTRKPLKGNKNKRRYVVESDWQTYWSSSLELQKMVKELGEDNFIREIVTFCESQWELKYLELKEQLKYDVLFNPLALNGIINVRLNRPRGKQ